MNFICDEIAPLIDMLAQDMGPHCKRNGNGGVTNAAGALLFESFSAHGVAPIKP